MARDLDEKWLKSGSPPRPEASPDPNVAPFADNDVEAITPRTMRNFAFELSSALLRTGGPAGETGPTGPTGPSGGPTGATGPTGPSGGPTGADGATGATGPAGAAGPSAVSADAGNAAILGSDSLIYVSSALDEVFVGPNDPGPAYELWIDTDALPPTAPPGATGPIGASGATGATGPSGVGQSGPRGSLWFVGNGPPAEPIAGSQAGDQYLDSLAGDVYALTIF